MQSKSHLPRLRQKLVVKNQTIPVTDFNRENWLTKGKLSRSVIGNPGQQQMIFDLKAVEHGRSSQLEATKERLRFLISSGEFGDRRVAIESVFNSLRHN